MDRRTFLTRGPAAMVALSLGTPLAEASTPKRQQSLALLESAERAQVQAQGLIHWPWRYHEARPLLEAAMEAAAEAWLLDRGLESKPRSHYTWFFVACGQPDEITGIAWRGMHIALSDVRHHCDPLGRMAGHKDFVGATRFTLQTRARKVLLTALNTAARCIQGVRCEVVHRVPARDPGLALK